MSIPRILLDPPWRRRTAQRAFVARAPNIPPVSVRLAWQPEEREAALDKAARLAGAASEERLETLLDRLDARGVVSRADMERLRDEHLAELAKELPSKSLDAPTARWLLARLGDAFVPRAIALVRARAHETTLFSLLLPVCASELAPLAAEIAAAGPVDAPDENDAERWLVRHRDAAVAGLASASSPAIASALAYVAFRAGAAIEGLEALDAIAPFARADCIVARAIARGLDDVAIARVRDPVAAPWIARALDGPLHHTALAWLRSGGDDARRSLAAAGTAEAERALAILDAIDPTVFDLPPEVPRLPAFFDAAALPKPLLADGTPLPEAAVDALGEMLGFSTTARPYRGVAHVKTACTAESLDAFAAAVLDAWLGAGAPPVGAWALEACAQLGGDRCVARIARAVASWAHGAVAPHVEWDDNARHRHEVAGDRGHALAQEGLAVLGEIGSTFASSALADLAAHGKQAWLRRSAELHRERAGGSAEPEEAELPTFGLDARGSTTLDFGARTFGVGWDESLAPYVIDGDGARLARIPSVRDTDDPAKAAAAIARFQALRDDTKLLARQELRALERAMCTETGWPRAVLEARYFRHPLLQHVARRLVWVVQGTSPTSFRIAEDRTLADEHDAAITLAESASVGLLHPASVPSAKLERWRALFQDYAIVQPFLQLHREVFAVAPELAQATQIEAAIGIVTTRGRLLGLSRRGWTAQIEAGAIAQWERPLPRSGATVRIVVEPAVVIDERDDEVPRKVSQAECSRALGELRAVERSELMRDLQALRRA